MKKKFKLEDLDCANCAAKMEEAANKTAGVKEATVAFMPQKMKVEFEEGAEESAVMAEVRKTARRSNLTARSFLRTGSQTVLKNRRNEDGSAVDARAIFVHTYRRNVF